MYTINKSAHTKKSGNLFNEPCQLEIIRANALGKSLNPYLPHPSHGVKRRTDWVFHLCLSN